MFTALIVLLLALGLLAWWCARDQSRAQARSTADTARLAAIRDSVDQLIETELEKLSPNEQARWRQKLAETEPRHPRPSQSVTQP
jgi:hypothetical protein